MERKILHIKNCIAEVMNYLLYVMAELAFFSAFTGEKPNVFRFMIPVAVPLFFYLVRCRVHRFWLFLLIHLLPFVWIIFGYGDSISQKFVFFLVAMIQVMVSLYIRITLFSDPNRIDYGIHPAPPPLAVGMGVALLLFNDKLGVAGTELTLIQIVIIFMLLYFVCLFMDNFLHYTEMSRKTTGNIPMKSIFLVDFAVVGGFAGICVIMMAAFADRSLGKALGEFIKRIMRAVLIFFIYVINFISSLFKDSPMEELPPSEQINMMPKAVTGNSLLAQIIDMLLTVIGTALAIAFAGAAIYGLVMLIKRAFAYRKEDKLAQEDESGDIIEKLERKKKSNDTGRLSGWFKTPDEKIRKIFLVTLRKKCRQKTDQDWERLLRYGTARECLALFGEDGGETALSFIHIYEKARYAKEECTAADAKEAARLAKGL